MQINRPMYYYYYYYVDQVKALGRKFRLDKIRNDGYASILETPTEMFEELEIQTVQAARYTYTVIQIFALVLIS